MNRSTLLVILVLLAAMPATAQRYRGGWDNDYKKFRIALQGGWSTRIAKVSTDVPVILRDYVGELKKGYHFGGNATFFFNRTYGVGIQYSSYRASNSMQNLSSVDTNTGKAITGGIADYVTINFIGPSFNSRYMFGANDNIHLLASVALGYMSYKNDALFFTPYMLKGNTIGASMNLGFDIALHENIYLGVEVGYLGGLISSMDYSDATTTQKIELKDDERESLARIDVSGGIRFNF